MFQTRLNKLLKNERLGCFIDTSYRSVENIAEVFLENKGFENGRYF